VTGIVDEQLVALRPAQSAGRLAQALSPALS
jgi:hypothetical protein